MTTTTKRIGLKVKTGLPGGKKQTPTTTKETTTMKFRVTITEEWVGRNGREIPDERDLKTLIDDDLEIDGRSAKRILGEMMEAQSLSFGHVHYGKICRVSDGKCVAHYQRADIPDEL